MLVHGYSIHVILGAVNSGGNSSGGGIVRSRPMWAVPVLGPSLVRDKAPAPEAALAAPRTWLLETRTVVSAGERGRGRRTWLDGFMGPAGKRGAAPAQADTTGQRGERFECKNPICLPVFQV